MNNLHLKTGLTYGVITSTISFCIGLALMFTGLADTTGTSGGWTSSLVLVMGIYLASEAFKKSNDGYLSHKDLIVTCLWMGLTSGVVSAFFGFLHLAMDPTMFEIQKNRMEIEFEKKGLSDAQIEESMKMMDKMFQPFPMAIIVFITVFLSMLFIGAIMGFFLKREKPVFDSFDEN
jgi:hypothetical protein